MSKPGKQSGYSFFSRVFIASLIAWPAASSLFGQPDSGFTISPTTVNADSAFNLSLRHPKFLCYQVYSDLNVTVNGRTIMLSYTVEDGVGICQPGNILYGPSFRMPPLPEGTYDVFSLQQLPCPTGPCTQSMEWAGVVNARVLRGDEWFLDPIQVLPDQRFTLDIHNYSKGNCYDRYSWDSTVINGNQIEVWTVHEYNPGNICLVNLIPWGPSIDISPLREGEYPVTLNILQPCHRDSNPCLLPIESVEVDTLIVAAITVGTIGHLKNSTAPPLTYKKGMLTFYLSEGSFSPITISSYDARGTRLGNIHQEPSTEITVSEKELGINTRGVFWIKINTGEKSAIYSLQRHQ